MILKTEERIIPENFKSKEEYLIYLRHLFAYEIAKNEISDNVFALEVGCGEGYGTYLLSKKATKIIGLDINKDTIAHASMKYESENCKFKVYDGQIIPYKDNTFDVVISFQVIEHIQNETKYISEIYRVLKKNGIFIISTPNKNYRLKPGQKPWNRFHLKEYYPNELENVLKMEFSNVKVWGIRGVKNVQRIEIERIKKRSIKKYFYKIFKIKIINNFKNNIINKNIKTKMNEDLVNKYSLSDFYIIKHNVKNSLDLLGICKK
jgi:ubiquinone/menaquinone biosynthesis C-methylase UbiE